MSSSRTCLWKSSSCGLLRKKLVSLTVRSSSSRASSCLPSADQQAVIAVERVEMALLHPPLQAVLQKMRAAFVEVHAAFLVDEGL